VPEAFNFENIGSDPSDFTPLRYNHLDSADFAVSAGLGSEPKASIPSSCLVSRPCAHPGFTPEKISL
jgi:hypothetical protein